MKTILALLVLLGSVANANADTNINVNAKELLSSSYECSPTDSAACAIAAVKKIDPRAKAATATQLYAFAIRGAIFWKSQFLVTYQTVDRSEDTPYYGSKSYVVMIDSADNNEDSVTISSIRAVSITEQ